MVANTLTARLVPLAMTVHVSRFVDDCNVHWLGIIPLAVTDAETGTPYSPDPVEVDGQVRAVETRCHLAGKGLSTPESE